MRKGIKYYFIVLSMLLYIPASAQLKNLFEKLKTNDSADHFLYRGSGLSFSTYRDFATSPLFYSGLGLNFRNGNLSSNHLRDRYFEVSFTLSSMVAQVPESDYFDVTSGSFFLSTSYYYHYIVPTPFLPSEYGTFRLGAAIMFTQNARLNLDLQNAGAGLENISNGMIVGRYSLDNSRLEPRTVKFWFIKKELKPVRRELHLQGNVGLLNFNYRPGYAYVYKSELDGTRTQPTDWVFDGYRWTNNGWRLGTRIEFCRYRPNGNGHMWAYQWDVASAPGRHELFEMASHRIQYILIINNNKN